jgi:predicted nucleotidyltransferase
MDFEKFLLLLRELEQHQVEYVLIGGVALNLHGIVRATEDIDLFVRPNEENIERVRQALRAIWADPDVEQITATDLAGEYSTVRYGPPDEEFVIDFLSRLGSAFQFDDIQAETIEIEGTRVKLATPLMLYRMKRNTMRLIDRADAVALREKFNLPDE